MGLTNKVKPAAIVKVIFVLLLLVCIALFANHRTETEPSPAKRISNGQQLPAESLLDNSIEEGQERLANSSSAPTLILEGGTWRIFEPLTDTKVRPFTDLLDEIITSNGLDTKHPIFWEFCRLPGDERILVSSTWPSRFNQPRDLMYKINLRLKTIEPVAGGKRLRFLEQYGPKLFVLEQLINEPFDLTTTYVSSAERIQERFRIHVIQANSDLEPQVFDPIPIHSVLFSDDKSFWVSRNDHVWQLSKDGTNKRQVCKVGHVRLAAFSPDKNLLALDTPEPSQDSSTPADSSYSSSPAQKPTSRESLTVLRVIDVRTGRSVFVSPKINVEISSFSSSTPGLQFTWLNNNVIRFSETVVTKKDSFANHGYFQWTDLDITSGARTVYKKYSQQLGLGHTVYVPTVPQNCRLTRIGLFDIEYSPSDPYLRAVVSNQVKYGKSLRFAYLTPSTAGSLNWQAKIHFANSSESISDVLHAELPKTKFPWRTAAVQISPDGRWAVIRFSNGSNLSRVYLVDGEKRKTALLSNEFGYAQSWLQ